MKRVSLYICMLALIAVAPGCRKYLYEAPINNSYDEIFWVNEKNANQSVVGAYHLFRSAVKNGNAYFTFADVVADLMENRDWNYATLLRDPGNYRFGYVPYLEDQLWDWSPFYDAIAQCNLVLQKLPTIPESGWTNPGKRDELRGEAYFLRAYAYFYMLRVWGEPVMRLTPISEEELDNPPSLPRSKDEDALKQIRMDVDSAIALLNETSDEQPMRANKYAAYALKAHVAAWQHDYPAALSAADEVIGSEQYELAQGEEALKAIWLGETSEPIFELSTRYSDVFDETGGYGFFGALLRQPLTENNGAFQMNNGKLFAIPNPNNRNDVYYAGQDSMYRSNDLRLRSWYYIDTPTSKAMLVKYSNVNYRDKQNLVDPYIDNNLVMIRLADILLLRAEALANLNRPGDAITQVNEIRKRAEVEDYDAARDGDLKKFIVDERARELIGEGNCFYDLIRTGQLAERLPVYGGERWSQKGYYWPLNMRKLKATNNTLTQNFYWATH